MAKNKPWYEVLLAGRRILGKGEILTSQSIATECKIPTNLASAWLFKLQKWGYVKKDAKYLVGKRWGWGWVLTRWGFRFRAKRSAGAMKIAANPGPKED